MRTSYETTEVAFHTIANLPELSLGRTTARQILRMYEHALHREWPTEFD